MSIPFEKYVRCILATGCSATAARGTVSMSAKTFLSDEGYTCIEEVLPLERWFQVQREGLAMEAWTYAMIQVTRAPCILQWGFDETKLDGISTINQWVLVQDGDTPPEIVTIEAAGLMVGGTARQVAEHVRKVWDLGQQACLLLREDLGPEVADELVPMVGGGVLIHKIQSTMHDTCATANLVPSYVYELRETSGKNYYSDEVWENKPPKEKVWFDFLCGNHSRSAPLPNLPSSYQTSY